MKRFFTYIIATAVILTGCKEHCEVDNIPVFELSQSEFQMANYGGTVSVKVASKVNWTARISKNYEDWIKIKADEIESVDGRPVDSDFASNIKFPFMSDNAGGIVTVKVKVLKNEDVESRIGEVVFTSDDGQTHVLTIQQAAANAKIVIPGPNISLSYEQQQFEVKVQHNADLSYTISDDGASWISYADTRAMTTDALVFSALENPESEVRTATITVYNEDTGGGVASATVTITQKENPNVIPPDMERAFPDPLFRTYILNYFDTDSDGKISREEAEKITSISFTPYVTAPDKDKVTTLEGVQYFPNLTYLNVNNNLLTKLDISRNPALTYLDCAGNNLTKLDVTVHSKLTALYCYGNQLTELDLTNNHLLERLQCNSNQLTKLDVTQCPLLIFLSATNNKLTELDISKTNIGNNTSDSWPLDLYNNPLKTLYIKAGWVIRDIYPNPKNSYIPITAKIIEVND